MKKKKNEVMIIKYKEDPCLYASSFTLGVSFFYIYPLDPHPRPENCRADNQMDSVLFLMVSMSVHDSFQLT